MFFKPLLCKFTNFHLLLQILSDYLKCDITFMYCFYVKSHSSISVTVRCGRSACRAALRLAQNSLCFALS